VLVLETMYFPNEIRDTKSLNIPGRTKVPDRELGIAEQLIDSMTIAWKPERYEDTYRARVLDLLKRKGQGKEIDVEGREPEDGNVVDLMEALRRSLDERGTRRQPAKHATKSTTKRTTKRPARKTTARKATRRARAS
jgi:DNA end-binding protein Ku